MRFANPPGLASFLQKNVGYDQIGGRAVKDAVDQDLQTMGTMGQAQATGLATIAKDRAADLRREAQMYGAQQANQSAMIGNIAGAVGSLGSLGIENLGASAAVANDFNIQDGLTGFATPSSSADIVGKSIFG